MSVISSWITRQKKGDLIELSDSIGFTEYDGLRKVDLDVALHAYLEENTSRLSSDPRLAPFYNRRPFSSPIKRELSSALDSGESTAIKRTGRLIRRGIRTAPEDNSNAASSLSPSLGDSQEDDEEESEREVMAPPSRTTRGVVARTPGRSSQLSMLQNASQVPLPPSPAVIASNIERQTALIRNKLSLSIQDSGILETAEATRETLSTVTSVHLIILAVEAWALRKELIADKYFFTIPSLQSSWLPNFFHTSPIPIKIPDFFLLVNSSFWNPAILWTITSLLIPLAVSYFFNLSLNNSTRYRSGGMASRPVFDPQNYEFDPLTFNVVKALMVYAVFGRGVTFNGLVDVVSVVRINEALMGGWFGVLVGTGIGGLVTLYEAMLRK